MIRLGLGYVSPANSVRALKGNDPYYADQRICLSAMRVAMIVHMSGVKVCKSRLHHTHWSEPKVQWYCLSLKHICIACPTATKFGFNPPCGNGGFTWLESGVFAWSAALSPTEEWWNPGLLRQSAGCSVQSHWFIDDADDAVAIGLACHAERPFIVTSCSRDSTLRVWSIARLAQPLEINVLCSRPSKEIVISPGVYTQFARYKYVCWCVRLLGIYR